MVATNWRAMRVQAQRFSVKLMALYLGLLLVPILGIGLFVNFYIQRTVEVYRQQHYQDALAIQSDQINQTVASVQETILYLEQLHHAGSHADLTTFASAHSRYREIALVGDSTTTALDTTAATAWLAANPNTVSDLDLHDVHFSIAEGTATPLLLAAARIEAGILVITLDVSDLIGPDNPLNDEQRALLLPSGQALVSASLPVSLPHFPGQSGHLLHDDHTYFYYRTGPDESWLLLRRLPLTATQADLQDYYTTFSILLIGSVVSVIGLALLAIARIIEPIYQLKHMFDQLRRQDTPPKLPASLPKDEFGSLMADFVTLAEELERKRHIERTLVERLIAAQEEERKLIAYDLHDGLIQQLVGARFYLRKCKSCTLQADSNGQMQHGYEVLTQAITEGRRLIQGLHPTVLDDLGLVAALQDLLHSMAKSAGWQVTADMDAPLNEPDRATSVTLYRLAQEAFNNAFKHANASHITLKLRFTPTHMTLTIADNGCGFDPAAVAPTRERGWGLRTMQERAYMLKGTFELRSQPGSGTEIFVQIPCHQLTTDTHIATGDGAYV